MNELNIPFTYHPCCFEYTDSNGNEHRYFPDFEVNGKLYEIKGSYLMKDGKLYFPYRSNLSTDELAIFDDVYECKFKCMIDHNVTILSEKEIQKIDKNSIF